MDNKIYAYIYFGLAGLALIYFLFCLWREQNRYEEKFKEYIKRDLEDYFEVKYIKKSYFAIIWICFPLGVLCMQAILANINTSSLNWWGAGLVGILLLTVPSVHYIHKLRQKIVYDHGELRYCVGNKVKVRGSIYDVDKDESYLCLPVEGVNSETSLIKFISGDKIYFDRESMDHGYKLEALMIKKHLFFDREV